MKGKYRFLTILLGVLIMLICFTPGIYVNAATDDYSDVLSDLKLNEDFDETNYLAYTLDEFNNVNSDGKPFNDVQFMSVITIAESSNKELYIYVYNPTYADLGINARKISMSNEKREGYEAKGLIVYDLQLLSTNGVFQKYKLKNYIISSETDRYYNFVSLYRDTSNDVDSIIDDTITNFAAEKVGKQFVFYKLNGNYICECLDFEVLEIKVLLNDFFEIENGFTLGSLFLGVLGSGKTLRAYYVVFDIDDYIVDYIIDADLEFRLVREYHYVEVIDDNISVYLSNTDSVTYKPKGLSTGTYEWNRITKSKLYHDDLVAQGVHFNDDVATLLKENHFVFSYYEYGQPNYSLWSYYTDEVTILRIHFVSEGEHYNLGVVTDITSPDNNPGGVGGGTDWEKLFKELGDGFDTLFMLIGIVILLVVVVAAFPIFKFVLDGLVLIISLPFKIIDYIFPKKKK